MSSDNSSRSYPKRQRRCCSVVRSSSKLAPTTTTTTTANNSKKSPSSDDDGAAIGETTTKKSSTNSNNNNNNKVDIIDDVDWMIKDISWAPTFFPTIEEMEGSPLTYIEKIRPVAQTFGICKIVPPNGWNPKQYFAADMNIRKRFETKLQYIDRLQEGVTFGDGDTYNPTEYQRYASQYTKQYKSKYYSNKGKEDDEFNCDNLERDYWNIVEGNNNHHHRSSHNNNGGSNSKSKSYMQEEEEDSKEQEITIEYGNDVDTNEFGSGFPLSRRGRSVYATNEEVGEQGQQEEPKFGTEEYYRETWWNCNNIPWAPESILRHVKVGINGINVPWMYYGTLWSTFCWHNEDNYLYSIQYLHSGAPKRWYGVPGNSKDADGLEKVFNQYLSMKMRDVPDLLHHITTMFSPRLLQEASIPLYKVQQYPGEYVVTFPRSFHGGFSFGPNIGEAVNFAPHDWIPHGATANERYRSFARPAVFSHDRLAYTMAYHINEQTIYKNCKSLLDELERLTTEELQLRKNLIKQGVRDVSKVIKLPPNQLDQLDEDSADYDDKRLCYACKHVCFFSAVACECSQSKVSCLRHSHYMCRCRTKRRYLMIWTPEQELNDTVSNVRNHLNTLKDVDGTVVENSNNGDDGDAVSLSSLPDEVAEGIERDIANHKDEPIIVDPYVPAGTLFYEVKSSMMEEEADNCGKNIVSPIKMGVKTRSAAIVNASALHPPPEVTTDEEKGDGLSEEEN